MGGFCRPKLADDKALTLKLQQNPRGFGFQKWQYGMWRLYIDSLQGQVLLGVMTLPSKHQALLGVGKKRSSSS
jgi:hypothetical protein